MKNAGRFFLLRMADTIVMNPFQKVYRWGKAALHTLAEHKYTTLAGTLVFFLLLSFMPFLFWLLLIVSRTGLNTDLLFEFELFGWARELLTFFKNNAEGSAAGASFLFFVTTLWSSTSFFYHLRRSGEIIYNAKSGKKGWRVRLSAFVITVLLLLFFAFVSVVLIATNLLARSLPAWLFYTAKYALVLVLGFFSAWVLNLYICPYRCSPIDTVAGSILTALAWLVASIAFSVYLRFARPERLYGALSVVIVFLLWLYWMFICFTSGVIYNRHRMHVFEPKKL